MVRPLANPRIPDRGNANATRTPQSEEAPCLKQGKERKCKVMESNGSKQVIERLNARSSEEPCAGKPHAGICEGGGPVTGASTLIFQNHEHTAMH